MLDKIQEEWCWFDQCCSLLSCESGAHSRIGMRSFSAQQRKYTIFLQCSIAFYAPAVDEFSVSKVEIMDVVSINRSAGSVISESINARAKKGGRMMNVAF